MSVAASYFSNVTRPYWEWQDDNNVVAWTVGRPGDSSWSTGATIVFRGELLKVFQRLQSISLPPFGSVVLLMAACRDAWNDETDKLGLLAGVLKTGRRVDRLELLNRVFEGLQRVRALPANLRSSPEAKAEIAAMVFENQVEPPSPGAYELLLQALEHGFDEAAAKVQKVDIVDRLLRDLAWLDQGLTRIDATALAIRLKTGIEAAVVPVEVEVPVLGSARSLISELQDDPELGGVARLAKLLSATVNLPRPLSLPEELPLGGVSDISNRGMLDRLLLSELANDDQTLSVRVAMNEALYLRREVPPRPPARRRVILLDSGIRMWGVPRLFAASVGLALAAGADLDADVTVLRAAGSATDAVDFTTAAGLTDHLAALDARIHPGETLAAIRRLVDEAEDAIDVVVVTASDVVADRAFQRALAEAQFENVHLAVVDRSGDFALHLQTLRGRKLLKQASFALDDIFAPTKRPKQKLLDDPRDDLPAIFGAKPFPLRLSVPVDADRSWFVKIYGTMTYTRDGRLMLWDTKSRGALEVGEGLPEGDLHWGATRLEDQQGLVAVIGKRSRHGLRALFVDLNPFKSFCETVVLESEIEQPKHVYVHQGYVFIADVLNVNVCDPKTGALLAKRSLAGLTHVHSRFYKFSRSHEVLWKALAFDGSNVALVEICKELRVQQQIVSMFDGDDFEGPCAVLRSGSLLNPATNVKRLVRHNQKDFDATKVEVSRSGGRVLIHGKPSIRPLSVDTRTLAVKDPSKTHLLEAELFDHAKPIVMRHRFLGIGLDTSGRLILVARRDGYWPIEHEPKTGTLRLANDRAGTSLKFQHRFEPFESEHVPHQLWLATFDDGSRAVLDHRGLLHLKSSDDTLPEITIVLAEGVGACWFDDGKVCGSPYHVDREGGDVAWAAHVRTIFARFLERLR
jgi:hypothetical protein